MGMPNYKMQMRQTIRTSSLERHVHFEPYVALVLSGGYEEAGDNGRFKVSAGNAVFHDSFEAHLNRFYAQGATVLNLPVASGNCYPAGMARVADPDIVARMAEKSGRAAADLLISFVKRCTFQFADWPDELATTLMQCPSLKLSKWGEENGLAPWTLSRGFTQVFGISPEGFRARVRARGALRLIRETETSMAIIAAELGFSDQAHMSRSVKQLTGTPPLAWRSVANRFKTGRQRVH
jgi:AraC-like DNA-binding protein